MALAAAAPARAQDASQPRRAAPQAGEAGARSDIDRLIEVLRDDAARNQLIQALRNAERERAGAPAPASDSPQAALDRPASRFLVSLGDSVTALGVALMQATTSVRDLPSLYRGVAQRFGDPETRGRIAATLGYLAAILGVASLSHAGAAWLRRRWRKRLEARKSLAGWRLAGHAAADALAGLVPPALFWIAAMAAVALLQPGPTVTLIAMTVANAQALAGVILAAPRTALAPSTPGLRLAPVEDAAAARIYARLRDVVLISVYGYFFSAAAPAAGLPEWVGPLSAKLVGVAIAAMLAALVLRCGPEIAWGARRLPPVEGFVWHRRRGFWQAALLSFLVLSLAVWLTRGADGMAFLIRATALSLIAACGGLAAAIAVRRGLDALVERSEMLRQGGSAFGARIRAYMTAASAVIIAAVACAAMLAVAQAWDVPAAAWLAEIGGPRFASSAASLALIAAIGVAAWEGLNLLAERLIRADESTIEGMRRAARRRTLLPLARRASLAMLGAIIGMIALSEIGINIAPIIAGAGVIGVAVGFGAQQIVRDLLGGVSVLAEDSIAVGDVVSVAGKGGVVEWMSLRALRLRDFDGTVHTIPFGEITTVSNQTKHFAFAVFKVGVSYEADIDGVNDAIRDVVARMREDKRFARMILDDVEMHGIDSFTDATVVVLARLKVAPAKQWDVMRQFQLLLKRELERRGIPQRPMPLAAVPWQPRRSDQQPPAEPQGHARASSAGRA